MGGWWRGGGCCLSGPADGPVRPLERARTQGGGGGWVGGLWWGGGECVWGVNEVGAPGVGVAGGPAADLWLHADG